jgi:hypothetical protein
VIWVHVIGWTAVVFCLWAYLHNARLFDWSNVALCVPVALPAILLGAYSSAAVSLAFGVLGAIKLWKERQ